MPLGFCLGQGLKSHQFFPLNTNLILIVHKNLSCLPCISEVEWTTAYPLLVKQIRWEGAIIWISATVFFRHILLSQGVRFSNHIVHYSTEIIQLESTQKCPVLALCTHWISGKKIKPCSTLHKNVLSIDDTSTTFWGLCEEGTKLLKEPHPSLICNFRQVNITSCSLILKTADKSNVSIDIWSLFIAGMRLLSSAMGGFCAVSRSVTRLSWAREI